MFSLKISSKNIKFNSCKLTHGKSFLKIKHQKNPHCPCNGNFNTNAGFNDFEYITSCNHPKDLEGISLNMQNAIISYVLTLAVFMPVSGFLADKIWNEESICSRNFTFHCRLCFVRNFPKFDAFGYFPCYTRFGRKYDGAGWRLALLKTFDKNEIVEAMNFAIIPALIGPVLGPLVGGYMVDYFRGMDFPHQYPLLGVLIGVFLGIKFMPITNLNF